GLLWLTHYLILLNCRISYHLLVKFALSITVQLSLKHSHVTRQKLLPLWIILKHLHGLIPSKLGSVPGATSNGSCRSSATSLARISPRKWKRLTRLFTRSVQRTWMRFIRTQHCTSASSPSRHQKIRNRSAYMSTCCAHSRARAQSFPMPTSTSCQKSTSACPSCRRNLAVT